LPFHLVDFLKDRQVFIKLNAAQSEMLEIFQFYQRLFALPIRAFWIVNRGIEIADYFP
jgi:hypothetical protein